MAVKSFRRKLFLIVLIAFGYFLPNAQAKYKSIPYNISFSEYSAGFNQYKVHGTVIDASTDETMPGVNVVIKGTTRGTSTDQNGNYELVVPSMQDTLLFSFIGYRTQEIPLVTLSGTRELNIRMQAITSEMSEVIVTSSYGTIQKRSELVSSAYQITAKDIANLPPQRVDQLLDGIVPGLQYNPQSDDASSSRPRYSVTIRGEASLSASNEPLWIVDGIRLNTGGRTNMISGMQTSVSPLSYLNPEDIESITVLKDASATSLYGADGANGVVLITTKRGTKGSTNFDVSVRHGVSRINESTRFKVLNGQEYLALAKEAYINAGHDLALFPFTDNELNEYSITDTDWYDVFYDWGNNSQVNLSASGGKENYRYYVSGSYFRDEKTVRGNLQERLSLRTNNTVNVTEKLDLDFSLSTSYNINSLFTPGHSFYETLPIISPYDSQGDFRQYYRIIEGALPDGEANWVDKKFFNRVSEREQNDNDQRALALQANLQLSYEFLPGFHYTGQAGADYQGSDEDIYSSMKNWSGYNLDGEPVGYARWNHSKYLEWNTIHRINFRRDFRRHVFSGVAGFEMSSKNNTLIGSYGSGFINDHIRVISYASYSTGSSNKYLDRKMSYLGQLSYSFDSRYNLKVNVRKDGNSNFGRDVRWANFASAGASWNIHNESFFSSEWINVLRLKASYGSNGNSRIGTQEALGVYSISDNDQYAGNPGASMSKGANPRLSWETTYMTNVGLRIDLLDSRLSLDVEAYRNKTENLLSNLDVSRTTGNTRVYRNVGAIENKGIEATINSVNIRTKNFQWGTTLLASRNRNKILELYNHIPKNFNHTRWEEGKDINTYYLVRWAGVDPRDGAPLWYDVNGNVTRQYSTLNRVPYKNSSPDLHGSITNTFEYKNISLRVLANYTIGGYAFSSYGRNVSSDGLNIMSENQSKNQLDRWQQPGDLAHTPKLLWGISTMSVMNSTRYLYNKTNIKLQNIALTYSLSSDYADRLGLKGMSVSLIGNNLAVWTPYDKKDRNSYRNNMSGYPMVTSFSMAVNISF